ncbi:hypothetical protein JYK14_00325 [Siccirubricoccus sp. KC 17139]|uniref:LacI family transcriptional regulator n=1 Tax=Siccirubricoccus soli TaxID=2899147 RepID=A0ABT1CY88_9PROT|nr:hypothetical protein [Siccirubricoccus soli]MCO6414627.1 hypothetical protein [Siccirubricoccus soli]MCP2680757.1 hypothetical protein [Siccirubricoccus soli]
MTAATSVTVRVPLTIRRRGGRKLVVTPDGSRPGAAQARTRADPALVKALARAHRWKRLLESGRYASLSELATAERIDRSYLGKMLRLTLLAPDIVVTILDGRQSADLGLPALLEPMPNLWEEQRNTVVDQQQRLPDPTVHGSSHGGQAHV